MKKLFLFFIIIFIIGIIFISGCGKEPECQKNSDCSANSCQTAKCVQDSCVITNKVNCCGNNKNESVEKVYNGNKLTDTYKNLNLLTGSCACSTDFGECSIENNYKEYKQYSDFLTASCDELNGVETCTMHTNLTSTKTKNSQEIKVNNKFQVQVDFEFSNPFDVNKDQFNVVINPIYLNSKMDYIRFRHVKMIATQSGKSPETIIDKDLVEAIRSKNTKNNKLIIPLVINVPNNEVVNDYSHLKIDLNYDYSYDGKPSSVTTANYRNIIERKSKFETINLPIDYVCTENCNDNNIATKDYCVDNKGYCLHEYIEGKCGNYVCDPGETTCSCKIDCGSCEGYYSDSKILSKTCFGNTCQLKLDSPSRELSKLASLKLSNYMNFQLELNANFPFDISKDTLNFNLLFQQSTSDKLVDSRVQLLEMTLTDSDSIKIGSKTYENKYISIGDKWNEIFIMKNYFMEKRDITKDIKFSIRFKYVEENTQGENVDKYGTLTGSFSKWNFVSIGVI